MVYKYFVHYRAIWEDDSETETNIVMEVPYKLNDLDRIRDIESDIAKKVGAKYTSLCNFLRIWDE